MMSANVKRLPLATEPLEPGVVRGGGDGRWLVELSRGLCQVDIAFSCLVRPEPGDKVLVAWHADGGHLLAVLERPSGAAATLAFAGEARLEAATLTLSAARQTRIASPSLELAALRTQAYLGDVELSGEQAVARFKSLRLLADSVQSVLGQVFQRMKSSIRQVDGLDQSSCENALHTVRETHTLRSRTTMISARDDVKVDAERIHMG